ncbi:hypothetical protein SKAU_G00104390 [Synaphobranchus kaupii]|uniref:Uncharacterized protein n=1 Tax=Synaphobranchus kaupii TaxID=118154 RepID=A0A9Q1J7R0_SYNKA|nr:hypothetical protein SKAU_G00104390 [Synaphobranchus kaupii]
MSFRGGTIDLKPSPAFPACTGFRFANKWVIVTPPQWSAYPGIIPDSRNTAGAQQSQQGAEVDWRGLVFSGFAGDPFLHIETVYPGGCRVTWEPKLP